MKHPLTIPAVWSLPLFYALLIGLGGLDGYPLTLLSVVYITFYGVLTIRSVEAAYAGLLGTIAFLPIASFPFTIMGMHVSLLNVSLIALAIAWWLEARRRPLLPPRRFLWPLLVFLGLATLSVIVGSTWLPPRWTILRRFVEYLLSAAFIIVHYDALYTQARFEHLLRWLILSSTAAALVGIVLHLMPDAQAERFLFNLAPINYPRENILRHLLGDPSLPLRATGTHFDPNLFGGFVALGLMLSFSQPFAARRFWSWPLLIGMAAINGMALILSYSRAALLGSAAALALLALLDAPLLFLVMLAADAGLFILPATRTYVVHLIAGFLGRDAATQMRFEEYHSALLWIQRYPWLGVGIGGVPDADLVERTVSNAYLFIAERWGLLALAAWLITAAVALREAWAAWRHLPLHLAPLAHAVYAAGAGILIIGLLDHYWVNPEFSHMAFLGWLMMGLVLVIRRLQSEGTCL